MRSTTFPRCVTVRLGHAPPAPSSIGASANDSCGRCRRFAMSVEPFFSTMLLPYAGKVESTQLSGANVVVSARVGNRRFGTLSAHTK